MKKLFTLLAVLSLAILLSSNAFADSSLEQKKAAFKDGFMKHRIVGNDVAQELSKYDQTPTSYLGYYRLLDQTLTSPLLVVNFTRDFDEIGQLVISPKLQFKLLSAEDYPTSSYVRSLLEYNKDFAELN